MKKNIILLVFVLLISISAAGCGSAASTGAPKEAFNQTAAAPEVSESAAAAPDAPNEAQEPKSNGTVAQPDKTIPFADSGIAEQKLIFKGQVGIETLDFEKTRKDLCNYISSIGGFQQNSNVQGSRIGLENLKSAEFIFRIPKAKYSQAFSDMKRFGTVVSEQSSGEDVSEQYYDTEARLKTLKIQHERLQEFLKKAQKMEDMFKIEQEIQTTLYEIEKCEGSLKKMDSLITYSTLTVNINEVEQVKPVIENKGLFARSVYGFKNSVTGVWGFIQDLIVFLVASLPIIIPLGIISYFIYRIVRKNYKKDKSSE